MTKVTNYQLTKEIKEQTSTVFNFFCDLKNHVHLHPLLTEVKEVKIFLNEKGQEVTVFEIHEYIKIFGFISVPNSYIAHRVVLKEAQTCIFEVKSFPKVYLSASYAFSEVDNYHTNIKAEVTITTPWGLSGFVTKTAQKAHTTLLEQLKQYLEQKNESRF